jgi:Xaa-Pro aminopeptidase
MATPRAASLPILIFGDGRQPALRHELEVPIMDPVLYLEAQGQRSVVVATVDLPRMRAIPGIDGVTAFQELGFDEAISSGCSRREAYAEAVLRACTSAGIREAVAPPDIEASLVDALRNGGVSLVFDESLFALRRRRKTGEELAGIERAQRAAQAGFDAVCDSLRSDRESPSSDSLRAVIARTLAEMQTASHELTVVASGSHSADPLNQGTGPIVRDAPVVVDIFPRDLRSSCHGDFTRMLCLGTPSPELVGWHRDVHETLLIVLEAVRPGVTGEELNRIGCEHLARLGYATRLDVPPDQVLEAGVLHYIGHGVGLEVLEAPTLDRGGEELVVGDVITIEPGVYQPGLGGCRLEDLVVVTEDGCRNLTDYSYELAVI